MSETVLLLNIISTWFLTGLIWVTQMTQYPSFQHFRDEGFGRVHDGYRVRMAVVATAPMILEAVTGVFLLLNAPAEVSAGEAWLGLGFILLIWLSTLVIQVPLHERLSSGPDPDAVRRLAATNWIRTAAWTVRAALTTVWLSRLM